MTKIVKLVLSEESKEKFESLGTPRNIEENISIGFNWLGFFFSEIMLLVKTLWGTFIIAQIILYFVTMIIYGVAFITIMFNALMTAENYHDIQRMFGMYLAIFGIIIVMLIINGIIIGLHINKWHIKKLLTLGYFPATDEDRKVLIEKGILRK
ncbi:MAG: hypothetical protein ACRCSK_05845 [Fusobacteriaceae bacterium]